MGLATGATVAALGAWAWARLQRWRRKTPAELERLRRLEVNRRGRIAAGHIVDIVDSETGSDHTRLVLYKYEVAGVSYEAAQDVSALPEISAVAPGLTGQTASVKYDPQRPTNSIVACEAWSGLGPLNHQAIDPSGDGAIESLSGNDSMTR